MFSLETFHQRYETDTSDLVIRNRHFQFFVPRRLDDFLDPVDIFRDFPLWSKIWEASLVLADHLAQTPPDPEKRFLEIGCGLGLAGIVAASFGHRVTATEYNTHALDFVRANARANLPSSAGNLEILALDWNKPRLEGSFDCILGSEVIYHKKDFEPILKLLRTYLRPEGHIILAAAIRKTSVEFFRQMARVFHMTARKKVLRSDGNEARFILCTLRFKG
jgi:2-polyprenyl-3-methyl-5-hydroxy-6-metoxy-1,4-benzoquinol methylase